jgi:uncharacterized protein YggU (UPF0235/DUF167 family)
MMKSFSNFQFGYIDKFADGITEEEFIDNFDDIREEYNLILEVSPESEQRLIKDMLFDIHISNPSKNGWANDELSDKLKLFLKLKGEVL